MLAAVSAALLGALAAAVALGGARAGAQPGEASAYAYDMAVAAVDVSGLVFDPQSLRATGIVTAVLRHEGGELPPGPLRLTFYAERDDREGLGAGDVRLAERRVAGRTAGGPGMAAGETRTVTAPISAVLALRGAPIGARLSRLGPRGDRETTNDARDSIAACRRPAAPGDFGGALAPRVLWRWPGDGEGHAPIDAPLSVRVGHAPVVMDVTGDDVPDVIVQTIAPEIHPSSAHLRALDGRTGQAHWTVTEPAHAVYAYTAPAAGDVDGDGRPEIVAIGGRAEDMRAGSVWRALAFRGDGSLLWESAPNAVGAGDARVDPGVTLADVDADGRVEVLAGGAILDGATGATRLSNAPPRAIVADVDRDGQVELVSGPLVYRAVADGGRLRLVSTPLASVELTATKHLNALMRLPGAAAGDGNPAAGAAHVGPFGVLSLFRLDGGPALYDAPFPGRATGAMQRQGGPPVVADFDGDGQAEVGVAGQRAFAVFDPSLDPEGTLRLGVRDVAVSDDHYGFTGAAAFDLDGDGRWELVHGDEATLYVMGILAGRDDALQILWRTPRRSATNSEMPIVADVDADGRADIVAPNEPRDVGDGITVYANDAWMTARRVWNQHAYFVDNVGDDGAIPAVPKPSWLRHGTFRANPLPRGDGSANAAANLTAGRLVALADASGGTRIQARIGNAGAAPAGPGINVAFFRDDAEDAFARVVLTRALGVGRWLDVSAPIDLDSAATVRVWVDPPAGRGIGAASGPPGWPECDEADNVHAWRVEPPVPPTPTADPPPSPTPAPPTALATDTPATPPASSTPSVRAGAVLYLPDLRRDMLPCARGRPTLLVVVADASASMGRRGSDGRSLRALLAEGLAAYGAGAIAAGHSAGLVTFDGDVLAALPLTNDPALWSAALAAYARPSARPGSALDAAIVAGAVVLADAGPGGKALLVATDAFRLDRGVARRAVDAADAARRAGVPVAAVGIGAVADAALLARIAGSADRVAQGADAVSLTRALAEAVRATRCGGRDVR